MFSPRLLVKDASAELVLLDRVVHLALRREQQRREGRVLDSRSGRSLFMSVNNSTYFVHALRALVISHDPGSDVVRLFLLSNVVLPNSI